MKESFRGIIVDLNVYENMLAHMKMNIEGLKERLRDEKNKNLIMDIVEKMRKAYNDYRELNKRVDNELKVLKASIK
jgi:nitrate/nitrite-specific signal transduction histidine kinase